MHLLSNLILFGAAVIAGSLNAISGGGSFISFPALLLVGIPPVSANATNTAALWPGLVASSEVYQQKLGAERQPLLALVGASLLGGLFGSLLLLRTPPQFFAEILPYLLLLSTFLFTFSPQLRAWVQNRKGRKSVKLPWLWILILQFVAATYGGFFGGGIGIILLAILSLMGCKDMNSMLFQRTLLSAVINGMALIPLMNVIQWPQALLMSVGALIGGVLTADYVRKLHPMLIRRFVIFVGSSLTLYFFCYR
jgi:uncharacterized protein